MSLAPAIASVREIGDGVIALDGELDVLGARQVSDALAGMISRIKSMVSTQAPPVVFDLGGLKFMDSSGIALLLGAAHELGGSVRVRNPSAIIRRVIALTGLLDILVTEEL